MQRTHESKAGRDGAHVRALGLRVAHQCPRMAVTRFRGFQTIAGGLLWRAFFIIAVRCASRHPTAGRRETP